MDDEPMVRHWKDVERWLRDEAAACLERGDLPRTVLVVFHGRRTALVVTTTSSSRCRPTPR